MTSTNIRLSICIPTLNRTRMVIALLTNLIESRKFCDYAIEICISNNSNNDLHNYINRSFINESHIRYTYQEKIIPIDENMRDAAKLATGEYVFLLGDDNFIDLDSLQQIIKVIYEKPDLIIMLPHKIELIDSKIDTDKNTAIRFKSLESAFRFVYSDGGKSPFGSVIYRRDLFNQDIHNYYNGTSHAYIFSIWDKLLLEQRGEHEHDVNIVYLREPIVYEYSVDKTWGSFALEVRLNHMLQRYLLLYGRYPHKFIIDLYHQQVARVYAIVYLARLLSRIPREQVMAFRIPDYLPKACKYRFKISVFLSPIAIKMKKFRNILCGIK